MPKISKDFPDFNEYDHSLLLLSHNKKYQTHDNFLRLIRQGAKIDNLSIIGNLALLEDDFYITYVLTHHTPDLNTIILLDFSIFNLVAQYNPHKLPLLLNYAKANDDIIEHVLEGDDPYMFQHLMDRGYKMPRDKTTIFYRLAFDIGDRKLVRAILKYCHQVRTNDLLGFMIAAITTDDNVVIKRCNDYLIMGYEAGLKLKTINYNLGTIDYRLVTNTYAPEDIIQVRKQIELDPERDIYDILVTALPNKILKSNLDICCDALFTEYIRFNPKFQSALDYIKAKRKY